MRPELTPYIELMYRFCERKITASEFEEKFLTLYKNDPTNWSSVEFQALEEVFGAVDAFCADDELRDEDDLDEEQLLSQVAISCKKIY